MRLLLDTHILFWSLGLVEQLSEREAEALQNPANQLFVSSASLLELHLKADVGKLTMPASIVDAMAAMQLQQLPISWAHAEHVRTLPLLHRDPFDRLLVAQAQLEQLKLMTRDAMIAQYDVAVFDG